MADEPKPHEIEYPDGTRLALIPWRSEAEIGRAFAAEGFREAGAGLYVQDGPPDAVRCVLAFRAVAGRLPWLPGVLAGARMMRVEDACDLMPALRLS